MRNLRSRLALRFVLVALAAVQMFGKNATNKMSCASSAIQNQGVTTLESADPMVLPERTFQAATYKRAVYCRAKASLLPQFVTIIRRDSAENLGKELPDRPETFLAFSQQAVRSLQGRGRITAALL